MARPMNRAFYSGRPRSAPCCGSHFDQLLRLRSEPQPQSAGAEPHLKHQDSLCRGPAPDRMIEVLRRRAVLTFLLGMARGQSPQYQSDENCHTVMRMPQPTPSDVQTSLPFILPLIIVQEDVEVASDERLGDRPEPGAHVRLRWLRARQFVNLREAIRVAISRKTCRSSLPVEAKKACSGSVAQRVIRFLTLWLLLRLKPIV